MLASRNGAHMRASVRVRPAAPAGAAGAVLGAPPRRCRGVPPHHPRTLHPRSGTPKPERQRRRAAAARSRCPTPPRAPAPPRPDPPIRPAGACAPPPRARVARVVRVRAQSPVDQQEKPSVEAAPTVVPLEVRHCPRALPCCYRKPSAGLTTVSRRRRARPAPCAAMHADPGVACGATWPNHAPAWGT
jgi:hypothetical protein